MLCHFNQYSRRLQINITNVCDPCDEINGTTYCHIACFDSRYQSFDNYDELPFYTDVPVEYANMNQFSIRDCPPVWWNQNLFFEHVNELEMSRKFPISVFFLGMG